MAEKKFRQFWNDFPLAALRVPQHCAAPVPKYGCPMRDEAKMNDMSKPRPRRMDDGLGPTSDIGAKLRALYGAVQDEGIPEKILDLLEKLDQAEKQSRNAIKSE